MEINLLARATIDVLVSYMQKIGNTKLLLIGILETIIYIAPQEFIVILGHNDSGKSTLLKILTGEIPQANSGKVLLNN